MKWDIFLDIGIIFLYYYFYPAFHWRDFVGYLIFFNSEGIFPSVFCYAHFSIQAAKSFPLSDIDVRRENDLAQGLRRQIFSFGVWVFVMLTASDMLDTMWTANVSSGLMCFVKSSIVSGKRMRCWIVGYWRMVSSTGA